MSQPVSVGEDNDNNNNAEGDGKRLEQQRSGNKREKELEDEEEEVEDEEVHTDAENTPTPPPAAAMAIVRKVTAREETAAAPKVATVGNSSSNRGSGKREGRKGINHQAPDNGQQQKQEQKTGGSVAESRAGGSAASASSMAPTDDVESQATTTNVDESGDSDVGGTGAAAAGGHNEPGKMFVGGLSWQTSAEGLRDYFCKFGEVNECMVMRDPTTKRARGFGFITFCDPIAVEKVLAMESHELDGKRIDPKIAFPKKQQPKMVIKTKKVFIGGLSASSTLEDIKNYFSQYGHIEDAMLMFDKSTQRHRGFGFITFDDDEVSDKVCEIHFHEINGKMVECKKAQPKEVMLPLQLNKTRAAAARNLYGLAPEQLLAYASYIPRLPANAYGPGMSTAAVQHHGMLTTAAGYPTCSVNAAIPGSAVPTAAFSGNGFPGGHPHHSHRHHHQPVAGPPSQFAAIAAGGHSVAAIRSGVSNNGGLNPRDLATAQLVAQQQAVYEAAMVYANQLSTLAASASMDFSAAVHHQHHQQQQHPMAAPQHQQQPGHLQFPASVVSGQPMALALHSAGPPQSAQAALPPPPPQSAHFGKQQ